MKRFLFVGVILILNLTLAAWTIAQGGRTDLFDQKKVDQELEIMSGILGTTLNFAAREAVGTETPDRHGHEELIGRWGFSGISGFYLYGQGATFLISTSRLIPAGRGGLRLASVYEEPYVPEIAFAEAEKAYQYAVQEIAESQSKLAEQSAELAMLKAQQAAATAVAAPQPPQPPAAVGQPVKPSPEPKVKTRPTPEEMRKRIAEAQEKVKQQREEAEQRRQKFTAALAQVKVHLVEALANHGDSLTFVKPNEYINLVLATDEGSFMLGGGRSDHDIISVQKSVVSDYKAGRLTMDALKQKVLQYSN